jgi:hypothetical protein
MSFPPDMKTPLRGQADVARTLVKNRLAERVTHAKVALPVTGTRGNPSLGTSL